MSTAQNEADATRHAADRQAAARFCIERIKSLGLKGKRAEDAAMHYLTGYYSGMAALDAGRAAPIGVWIAYVVAVRGLLEIRHVADGDAQ